MLHRLPTRQPRYVLLGGACLLLLLVSGALGVFYAFCAPNWDVPLILGAFSLLLLWPGTVLFIRLFAERVIQVEHAGVVLSSYLWGHRLSRRVWLAEQVRHFDWERSGDDLLALRLVLRRPDGTVGYATVLHTDSAYAMASILRDLELHYPGSGLYEQRPLSPEQAVGASRLFSAGLLLGGLVAAVWLVPISRVPLEVAAGGTQERAEVQEIVWDSDVTQRGTSYRLRLLPQSADEPVVTASSFYARTEQVPRVGEHLVVLWLPGSVCYLPGEVMAFLLPLPGMGGCLLLSWFGLWGLMRSGRRPR